MAAVGGYVNGSSAGIAGRPTVHQRGEVKGWTAATVRRHQRWLWSVRSDELVEGDLYGVAFTLTVRDLPPSAEDWRRARDNWIRSMKDRGLVRLHWVTEWQRRGVPHMHVAAYFEKREVEFGHQRRPMRVEMLAIASWCSITADWGSNIRAQDYKPIAGVNGWLEYLSKHAARGVKHYQRQGIPEGWEKSGRLWGYSGAWPRSEPTTWDISTRAFWRYRRLVRSWTLASARASGDPRRIAYARRMLKCGDHRRSAVRGVSGWIPEAVTHRLIAQLEWEGFDVRERSTMPSLRAAEAA
jgi:hypothetical protein